MKRLAVTFALACAAFALASPAQAALTVGVADDRPLGAPDSGAAFFTLMNDVGLREVRLSVLWDATQPMTIVNQAQIESVLPVATLRGMKVVFSVAPLKARSISVPERTRSSSPSSSRSPDDLPDRQERHRRQRAEPAAVLAAAVRLARPGRVSGAAYRGAARAELRRAEGRRSGDQRHRRRALAARQRQPARLRATSPPRR